jgi:hypothetical protein
VCSDEVKYIHISLHGSAMTTMHTFLQLSRELLSIPASARKLVLMGSFGDVPAGCVKSSSSSPTPTGNRVMDVENLCSLVTSLACPSCKNSNLTLQEGQNKGLNSKLHVLCTSCDKEVATMNTSKHVGRYKTAELNLRAVASSRNAGLGYQRMSTFLAGLNMPPVMAEKTHQTLTKQVHLKTMETAEHQMAIAAATVRELYMSCDDDLTADSTINITISFDGTWHKRGHSSHYGVGVVIDYTTGLVLDAEVLSNYCQGCVTGNKPDDELYSAWKEKHQITCQKNYIGSANSMEVGAAKRVFSRSVEKYNLRYTTVICDGDAKTIAALNEMPVS